MTRISRVILTLVGVTLVLVLGGSVALSGTAIVDHYKVYNVDPKYPLNLPVILRDQFGDHPAQVMFLDRFANPVSKNGEPISDPNLHYAWWMISSPEPPHDMLVGNQFGQDQLWRTFDAIYLLNPALKGLQEPPPGPPPPANHYKCYVAQGPPIQREVVLADQFGTRTAVVLEPQLLCNPVEKVAPDGVVYPILDPLTHLACYRIDPPMPYGLPAFFFDQFLAGSIRFTDDCLLCVPSTKNIIVPTLPQTWGRVKALYR